MSSSLSVCSKKTLLFCGPSSTTARCGPSLSEKTLPSSRRPRSRVAMGSRIICTALPTNLGPERRGGVCMAITLTHVIDMCHRNRIGSVEDAGPDAGGQRRHGVLHLQRHVLVEIHDQVADLRVRAQDLAVDAGVVLADDAV